MSKAARTETSSEYRPARPLARRRSPHSCRAKAASCRMRLIMNALYLVVIALAVGTLAYRYYSAFLAARVMMLDDTRKTPAHTKSDGSNYYPTQRWVLFGHHFAAIAGAGPLVGPVFAAQFG